MAGRAAGERIAFFGRHAPWDTAPPVVEMAIDRLQEWEGTVTLDNAYRIEVRVVVWIETEPLGRADDGSPRRLPARTAIGQRVRLSRITDRPSGLCLGDRGPLVITTADGSREDPRFFPSVTVDGIDVDPIDGPSCGLDPDLSWRALEPLGAPPLHEVIQFGGPEQVEVPEYLQAVEEA